MEVCWLVGQPRIQLERSPCTATRENTAPEFFQLRITHSSPFESFPLRLLGRSDTMLNGLSQWARRWLSSRSRVSWDMSCSLVKLDQAYHLVALIEATSTSVAAILLLWVYQKFCERKTILQMAQGTLGSYERECSIGIFESTLSFASTVMRLRRSSQVRSTSALEKHDWVGQSGQRKAVWQQVGKAKTEKVWIWLL